jgi:hypothetical protein
MNALLVALILGQATTDIQIRVRPVKSMCVVLGATGEARVVPRRALKAEEQASGCALTAESVVPRVEQHVEVEATAGHPEQRVIDIIY